MSNSKIKIAYLDYSHIFAGAERVLYTIIDNLNKDEYEPILIFPYPMTHHNNYNGLKCKKIYLADSLKWWMGSDRWEHPLRGSDFLMRTIMGYRLANELIKEKVNILHVNLIRPDSLMWIKFAKSKGIKVIGHFRSQAYSWVPPKSVQKNCSLVICVSKYSESRFLSKGEYTETKVVYDSINIDYFKTQLSKKQAKIKLGFQEDCVLISSVGQLSRHKGHDNAILSFMKIAEEYPNAILYIAGGGNNSDLEYLKALVKNDPKIKNRVVFSGTQVENIVEVYQASDLVLSLTKVGEAFGLVPYESAIMGVPFIAPIIGAVTEFIEDGYNGYLVDTNNVEKIAAKIHYVLEHPKENKNIIEKAQNTIISKLTTQIMTLKLCEIYRELNKDTLYE